MNSLKNIAEHNSNVFCYSVSFEGPSKTNYSVIFCFLSQWFCLWIIYIFCVCSVLFERRNAQSIYWTERRFNENLLFDSANLQLLLFILFGIKFLYWIYDFRFTVFFRFFFLLYSCSGLVFLFIFGWANKLRLLYVCSIKLLLFKTSIST